MEQIKSKKKLKVEKKENKSTNKVLIIGMALLMITTVFSGLFMNKYIASLNQTNKTYVQTPYTDIISNVESSVFGVVNKTENGDTTTGSGFAYRVDEGFLYILTNAHVVDKQEDLYIYLAENAMYKAQLVGSDVNYDLAVLKVKVQAGLEQVKPLQLGDSSTSVRGDSVIAIGSPLGPTFYNTSTLGIVSSPSRFLYNFTSEEDKFYLTEYIQIDAAINHGNSGGPLFNMNGEVVGMNSAGIAADENEDPVANFGFAIPMNVIKMVLPYLEEGKGKPLAIFGAATESYSTIMLQNISQDPNGYGVYIAAVDLGTPASEAGLQAGDFIVKMDGVEVYSTKQIEDEISKISSPKKIKFTILRSEKTLDVTVDFNMIENKE